MDTEKRGRGRPKGSSSHQIQDAALLRKVAEMMEDDSDLTKTAAIKRLIGVDKPSDLHRLQEKFKSDGEQLRSDVRAARQRQLDQQARWAETIEQIQQFARGVSDAMDSPKGQETLRNIQGVIVGIRDGIEALAERMIGPIAEIQGALAKWSPENIAALQKALGPWSTENLAAIQKTLGPWSSESMAELNRKSGVWAAGHAIGASTPIALPYTKK